MEIEKLTARLAKRIEMIRKDCLGWSLKDASSYMNIPIQEIKDYESNKEPVSCGYFISLCECAGVCLDSMFYLPDRENPQGLMRWSFEHYIYKLGYTDIDKTGEFENFKEPNVLEILDFKDFKKASNIKNFKPSLVF